MQQPEGFVSEKFPNHVCKLNKAIYGLKQAPRAWFNRLKTFFTQWGLTNSKADSSLFFLNKGGKKLLVLLYVDDILVTGDDAALIHRLITDLNIQFALKNLGAVNY